MKKIIIATSTALIISAAIAGIVLAENTDTSTTNTNTKLNCAASAVAKRESAIQSDFSTLSSSITSALKSRAEALALAWGMTDKTARNAAIKTAWSTFSQSAKIARKTHNDVRKGAWDQFGADRKTCKFPPTGENPASDAL